MASKIPDHDVFGTAMKLVTDYGFRGAKAQVTERILEWSASDAPYADKGVLEWERVQGAIALLHARMM